MQRDMQRPACACPLMEPQSSEDLSAPSTAEPALHGKQRGSDRGSPGQEIFGKGCAGTLRRVSPSIRIQPRTPERMPDNDQPDDRSRLLNAIPMTAKAVLAVGRQANGLSAAWQARCPLARWIEADTESVADEVALKALLGELRPDCLICSDLLEQVEDPSALLRRLASVLSSGATVLLYFANGAHWAELGRQLRDHWNSEHEAPFEAQRRRYYSSNEARTLLADAGLKAIRSRRITDTDTGESGQAPELDSPGLAKAFALDTAALQKRLSTAGYLVIATKGDIEPDLHIQQLVMVPNFMTVRTEQPMLALDSLANVTTASDVKSVTLKGQPAASQKLLIIQRQIVLDAKDWLQRARQLSRDGWILVAEWDDHPDLLPAEIKAKWDKHPWLPMQAVHAVQTSTAPLAEAFRRYNPHVAVFENALLTLPPLPRKTERRVRIIFAALNREEVNAWLEPVLNAVLADYPQTQIAVIHNRALYDALDVDEERKSFRHTLSYPSYMTAISQAHIALLPLAGSEAERYKSDVKFIECASRGTVCIASPLNYEGRIVDGHSGIIARSPDDWAAALRRLIEDSAYRDELAGTAYDYCREERMLSSQIHARLAWYHDLCSRQAALHEELMQRLDAR